VVVNPTPVANLSFEQACQGNEVAFTSLSQGNGAGTITHYEWNFGDPTSGIDNTSDLVNPTHIYENPGTYGVSLTVTAINGCSDTRDTTITVNPAPEVDFAFEAACLGDATVFNSLDYVDVASIGEWHWDFGDGTTSNNPDPEHVYVIAGSYEVVLTVTDINGCDASAVKTVDIMNAPVAAFIFSGDACEGGVISFDDQSTADEVISQWVWDFGDGTTETVDYPNNPDIEHTFVQDGTFNVTLSIITETACESTYTQEVIISTAPEALIEYTPACLNAPFSFEGDALLNGGTEIWQWAWDFGDPLSGVANTSELQNANHTYTTAGTYTVSLVVTNMDGCTDTAFVDVSVGALPEIAMHISSPTCLGDTVSVDPDPDVVDMGAVDFIYWDMGDGNEYTADSVDHIYEFAGIYEITMTLTDTSGCVVSTLSEVEVTEKPIVQFDASAACEGNDTQFTDYSYVPNGEPIIQWAWDFDIDGAPGTATSELQNPTYNYPEAGDYTVRLVVTSASGCMDSIDMMISVLEGPNAGFTFEEFNCEAGKVIFTDTSEMTNNIPIVAWEWTFQDGYYSDEQHPYHIFDNTDETYDVILKVTDINGCEDSDTVAVYVPKALEVDFEYTPTCVGDVTYFNDTLIAPVGDTLIQWQWEFGDAASGANNFSTNQSPSHTYPEPGNYVVTLTATDKYYCTYTISKSIEIFPLPTAQFSYDQPQCSEELYFTDLSVGVVSQIQQWEWNWGDGSPNDIVTTAQTEPLAHTYLVDGDYDVSLTVTDENNCVHSFMMTVTKNPCVQALFAMSQDTICARNEVTIFDQSIPVGEVDNWTYDMGDGTTYTFDQTNYTGTFDHIYTIEGRYTISLNVDGVVNGTLYMDSEMHEIEVLSTPVPAFVAENVCFGLETQFIDQSTDAAVELISWNWDLGDEVHTSTQQDTSIIYAEYNTYDVKLIVENEAGCKDSITQQTRVYANPEADFSWDISCVTKPTFFYDETTLPEEDIDQEIVEWNWDFGVADIDWDASESQDPYYVYDTVMVHPVTLTVTDNHDCFSTLVQDIDTYVVPKANFSYEESDKMQGVVQFTDLSTGGEDLTWEYLDQLSIEQNPEITFEDDGTFPIHQIVKNEYQCADTMTVLYEMLFRTLFIPNAFSPNNPNTDVHEFKPIGRNLAEYRLQIYDLRGNLLFESTKLDENGVPEEGWDGKAMGIEMPAGIYMYHVTGIFEDGSIYNGTVIGDYKDSQMSNRGQLILIR
jgi:PKD repeat protein